MTMTDECHRHTLCRVGFGGESASPEACETDRALYIRYRERADQIPNLIVAGRLGTYEYLDMDQAIGAAMKIFERRVA